MIGKKKKENNQQPKEYNLIAIGLSVIVIIAIVITGIFVLKNRKPKVDEKPQTSEQAVEQEPVKKVSAKEILEKYVKEKAYEDELEQEYDVRSVIPVPQQPSEVLTKKISLSELYHKEVSYCIDDLNGDDEEELLVQIELSTDFYYTYMFAVRDEEVVFVRVLFNYQPCRYSDELKMLELAPEYNPPEGIIKYEFMKLEDMKLNEEFFVVNSADTYQKYDVEQVTDITQEEYDRYLSGVRELEWTKNGTMELERWKAQATEFEAPTFTVIVPKGWTAQLEYYPISFMKWDTEVPVLAVYKGEADKSNPYILISSLEMTGIGGMPPMDQIEYVEKKKIGQYETQIAQYGYPHFTVRDSIIGEDAMAMNDRYYNYTFRIDPSVEVQYLFDVIDHGMISVDDIDVAMIMDSFRFNSIGQYTANGYHERRIAPDMNSQILDVGGYDAGNTYYVYEIKELDGITWYRTGLYSWIADGQGQNGTYVSN